MVDILKICDHCDSLLKYNEYCNCEKSIYDRDLESRHFDLINILTNKDKYDIIVVATTLVRNYDILNETYLINFICQLQYLNMLKKIINNFQLIGNYYIAKIKTLNIIDYAIILTENNINSK